MRIHDVDWPDWCSRFNVVLSGDPDLERFCAVHKLTTYGREHSLGEWDVHIHDSFRDFVEVILLHEAVENLLRRQGWNYKDSHDVAMEAERSIYGGTPYYDRFLVAMGEG